ncbi:hypothetical protein V496_10295 [Pseudogymnoascus sp. VKM F-4515 (FW-2607)]|nr:hypothetical protein V496_10295 [Pseudogymnoascus sp. VKM F-4515 (FW-2607)]
MSDSKNGAAEEMPAGVKNLVVINHEYKKIICKAKGCGRAIKAVNLRKHLQGRHRIRISVARQASQVARGFRWDEGLWANVQPKDGLAPQVGLGDCYGHGVTDGYNAENARFQTWYGNFVDGYSNLYWVVDEGKDGESKEMEKASVEKATAEEDPSEQAPEEEVVEEMEAKDVPVDISEESEDWSEEEGREEVIGRQEGQGYREARGQGYREVRGQGHRETRGAGSWLSVLVRVKGHSQDCQRGSRKVLGGFRICGKTERSKEGQEVEWDKEEERKGEFKEMRIRG